jgi:hypothetical protein
MSASFSALLGRTFRTGGPLLLLLLLFVSAGNFRFSRPDSDCRSLLILGVRLSLDKCFLYIYFGGLVCVGHFFAYVDHLYFLRDIWTRTQELP